MTSDFFTTLSEPKQRFQSLELAATVSYDPAALGRALSRAGASNDKAARGTIRLYGETGSGSGDAWVRYRWRVWWAPPTLWRDELTWSNGESTVIIVRNEVAVAYVSMQRTLYTSEPIAATAQDRVLPPDGMKLPTIAERVSEFPLTRPLPKSEWEVTTLAQEWHMGRVTRRLRARRRAAAPPAADPQQSGYWPGVDEYECVVDDALQVLLSVTGLDDGVPVATISADDVRIDTPISPETFTFAPPRGTLISHVVNEKTTRA